MRYWFICIVRNYIELTEGNNVPSNLIYDHESDEDPSDSEWEQDTHLPTKISNRMFLISPPVSQLGDDW